MGATLMPKARIILGVAISLVFLYLAVRNVEWQMVLSSLKEIDLVFLGLTIACLFGSILCRAFLWKSLLKFEKKVSWSHAFEAIMIGYMGNNVLPFRMGELIRAYAMGKKEGLSKTLSLASIILERLLDVLSLLIFFVALFLSVQLARWLVFSGVVIFAFLVLMGGLVYLMAKDAWRFSSRLTRVLKSFPAAISHQAERITQSFIQGLALVKNKVQMIEVIVLSLLTWLVSTVSFYFCLKAFHLELPLTAPLLLVVVINMGVMIPSSPGFIGVFQYLCIVSLAFFSVPKGTALGFSVVLQATQYIPVTLLGWFYLTRMHLSLSRSFQAELEKSEV
jgi:glycosyltransferase 2 family protein